MNDINSRELGLFEMLAMGFDIFKKNYRVFFTITLIIGIPVSIILAFAGRIIVNSISSGDVMSILYNEELFNNLVNSGQIKNILIAYVVMLVMQALFLPLVTMAVADATGDYLKNEAVSAKKSILNSVSKGTVFIAAAIINLVLCLVGSMFFVIPGLIFTVWFYFFTYEIIYNNSGVIESLARSKALIKGSFLKMAVYVLFLNILSVMIDNFVSLILGFLTYLAAGEVFVRTIMIFGETYVVCVASILYLNRKAMVDKYNGESDIL